MHRKESGPQSTCTGKQAMPLTGPGQDPLVSRQNRSIPYSFFLPVHSLLCCVRQGWIRTFFLQTGSSNIKKIYTQPMLQRKSRVVQNINSAFLNN
jgi:hypothetical protein